MNETESIMFKCICAYGRICELRTKLIKTRWEDEESKLLEEWWSKLTVFQQSKIMNTMRTYSVQAQVLTQKNLKDKKDA